MDEMAEQGLNKVVDGSGCQRKQGETSEEQRGGMEGIHVDASCEVGPRINTYKKARVDYNAGTQTTRQEVAHVNLTTN